MSGYRLLVAYEVIEFLEKLPRSDQRLLRNVFVDINEWPSRFSDFTEPDSTGRNLDVHLYGKFAIRFWEDFADKHVKILDVTFADR